MIQKVSILIWQDVGVWHKVIGLSSKLFLHLYIVKAHSIFPGNFVRVREMVDSLILIEALI